MAKSFGDRAHDIAGVLPAAHGDGAVDPAPAAPTGSQAPCPAADDRSARRARAQADVEQARAREHAEARVKLRAFKEASQVWALHTGRHTWMGHLCSLLRARPRQATHSQCC